MTPQSGHTRMRNRLQIYPYEYTTLPTKTSVRLLKLHAGPRNAVLSCDLDIVERANAPPYEAISYTWGDPADAKVVLCGEGRVRVPASLRDMLQTLRSPTKTVTLWADAVCINQQDDVEKGHQVRIMGAIFAEAMHVLIWLGKEPLVLPEQYKIGWGQTMGERRDTVPTETILMETQIRLDQLMRDIESKNGAWVAATAKFDETYRLACSGMIRLFHHPWFERLWVLQEAGLARSAVAVFGGAAVALPFLFQCGERMSECQIDRRILLGGGLIGKRTAPFYIFSRLRGEMPSKRDGEDDNDFLDVLYLGALQHASDSRDFVYALLGHPSARLPGGSLIVEPDYTITLSDLYCLTAANIIRNSRSLRLLGIVEPGENHLEDGEAPTWVPQWDRLCRGAPARLTTDTRDYCASDQQARFSILADGRRLRVSGYVIDSVDELTKTMGSLNEMFTSVHLSDAENQDTDRWPLEVAFAFRSRRGLRIKRRISDMCCTLFANGRSEALPYEYHLFRQLESHITRVSKKVTKKSADLRDTTPEDLGAGLSIFHMNMIRNTRRRKLFSTASGLLGLGSHLLQSGDLCCVVHGCPMPLVLRKAGNGYRLLGTAYIQGLIGRTQPTRDEALGDCEFVLY